MADVKLLEPQRLTDNPNGGGLSTSTEIVDGAVNNLFDDISRIDRVNGDVSLRKAFVQSVTEDVAPVPGLHVIVAQPPEDEDVSVLLFRTTRWADERAQAKDAVERYLDSSVVTRMIPYDRQLTGQRTILAFQRLNSPIPDIGEVFEIEDTLTGESQAVRIVSVLAIQDTFTDTTNGDYQVRVLTLGISQPLERDFIGSEPTRYFRPAAGAAVIRRTTVSDAARFYGVATLAANAGIGDVSIKVDSVFSPLAPSATTEIPLLDVPPDNSLALVPATHRDPKSATLRRSVYASNPFTGGGRFFFGSAILPGSAMIRWPVGVGAGVDYLDAGDGTFLSAPGALGLTIDYDTGVISCGSNSNLGLVQVHAHPAAAVPMANFTHNIRVKQNTRGYVYAVTLDQVPAPGSTTVYYRAFGRWYQLQDQGDGVLRGDVGVGSGQINFATGTISITLGALPDIESSVIISYGQQSQYRAITQDIEGFQSELTFTVPEGNIEPGTFAFKRTVGGTTTAVDDGEGNLIPGQSGVSGKINYGSGEVTVKLVNTPTPGVLSEATYQSGAFEEETFNPNKSGSTVTLSLAIVPIKPGSLSLLYQQEIDLEYPGPIGLVHTLRDNGVGQLIDPNGTIVAGSSVNYTTGSVTFNPDFAVTAPSYNYGDVTMPLPAPTVDDGLGYFASDSFYFRYNRTRTQTEAYNVSFINGTAMIARYKLAATSDTPGVYQFQAESIGFDLTPNSASPLVPGSVTFCYTRSLDSANGRASLVVDRAGVLYQEVSGNTNAGTIVGTINYQTGRVTLTSWPSSITTEASIVLGGLVQIGQIPIPILSGRTPGSPLRPGSFSIRAVRASDGVTITAAADVNGNLSTSAIHGYVDVNTGVFSAAFGTWHVDAALTLEQKSEPWYNAANVTVDGMVWQSEPVIPGTIYFNAVVQSATPLDPQIIGINPVRMPLDGRVQKYRPGYTLVIHQEALETLPAGLVAGQVVNLLTTGLASIALYDQVGLGIPDDRFTVNLDTSTITMATPLDLTGYVQPLVAVAVREDMALCTDAEITGELKLAQALTQSFAAGIARVSSALVIGDVQARYENLFAQNTWTSVWSDALIGIAPTSGAQYNELNYPLVVVNRHAISMRWALVFTSSFGGNIVAEEIGVIGTFNTSVNLAPTNPGTGEPYFQMAAAGFGAGWATGNVIRFNTVAAGAPIWAARTVRTGGASGADDRARLQIRYDKD